MWDITWIKTDVRGIYYYAYVIEDLFDRSIVGWMFKPRERLCGYVSYIQTTEGRMIFENESDIHAKELFALCDNNKVALDGDMKNRYILSDGGLL